MDSFTGKNKITYLLISVLIILCTLSVFHMKIQVGDQDSVVREITSDEFSTLRFFNCHSVSDEEGYLTYVPDNDDPQVYLPVTDEKINSVKIRFAREFKEDTGILLFYCREGEGFKIENIAETYVAAGEKEAILFFPEDVYAILRLDIEQPYSIEAVDLGIARNNGSIFSRYYRFDFLALVLLSGILIVLFIFEKKIKYFNFVKTIVGTSIKRLTDIKVTRHIKKNYFLPDGFIEKEDNAVKTANCFAGLALVFGLLFIYLVPPSSCPDEYIHFSNICRILNGNVFINTLDGKTGSFLKPEELAFITKTSDEYSFDAYRNNKYSHDNGYVEFDYKDQPLEFREDNNRINPAAYISALWGVIFAKILFGISNPYYLLIWAKISNLLFSIFTIRLAIKKTPILRNTMFLLALMPMTIYQYSSVSYDTQAICGMFLLFSYVMRLILDGDYLVKKSDIVIVCFACACIFTSKAVYAPLILTLFAIERKKFGNIQRYIRCIFYVVLTAVIFYLLPLLITSSIAGDGTSLVAADEQRQFVLTHLDMLPTILINTFKTQKSFWLSSFIGVFGWVRIYLGAPFVYCYFAILLTTAFFETCQIKKTPVKLRFFAATGALITIIGIVLAMYIGWNPLVVGVKSPFALGVQGRYFIPVSIFLSIWLANPLLCKAKHTEKINEYTGKLSRLIAISYLMLTGTILFNSYWI